MINFAALNLLIFNLWLVHVIQNIYRIGSDDAAKKGVNQLAEHRVFSDLMLNAFSAINALLLLPTFLQNRVMGWLLGFILTWNIFIYQRILSFQLQLIYALWKSHENRLKCALIICFLIVVNGFYLNFFYRALKLQRKSFTVSAKEKMKQHKKEMEVKND
ncbi:uncharacterized protein LOC133844482 [Drosophila sulfurigaster albostrigata]|uniref:uncharacterized protein LOC133844482 n=1 Tax=Drosophila sulfurigaster albostrigata TaxID=89887 RepID=UPI002D21927B|nr:uncharacterized protein LOC133844482 [Drosophila sulfurigaster albostrigata]XP_062134484.1 uncharacterized protein LOC133844482 [Drosophila sulfurigaster albostrigata]